MKSISAREAIINTAARLFYRQGYTNTGINQIIEEAGIAKSTLYQHFRSKEELLLSYLEEAGVTTMEGLREATKKGKTPHEKLIGVFDYLEELVKRKDFYGCHFLNIVYEMPDEEEKAREVIKKQKDSVRMLFTEILAPIQKQEMADEIYTLFEGALIAHKVHNDPWPIVSARNVVRRLGCFFDVILFHPNSRSVNDTCVVHTIDADPLRSTRYGPDICPDQSALRLQEKNGISE